MQERTLNTTRLSSACVALTLVTCIYLLACVVDIVLMFLLAYGTESFFLI